MIPQRRWQKRHSHRSCHRPERASHIALAAQHAIICKSLGYAWPRDSSQTACGIPGEVHSAPCVPFCGYSRSAGFGEAGQAWMNPRPLQTIQCESLNTHDCDARVASSEVAFPFDTIRVRLAEMPLMPHESFPPLSKIELFWISRLQCDALLINSHNYLYRSYSIKNAPYQYVG